MPAGGAFFRRLSALMDISAIDAVPFYRRLLLEYLAVLDIGDKLPVS
jgi:hypothetical protein